MGANTFSQKFRPKQRESDATEDVQNSYFFHWQEFFKCGKKFLFVIRNVFLWQDISASDKKFHTVTRNFFLWQEISSCDKKFLTMAWNSFPWQEVSFCDKYFFQCQKISSYEKTFLLLTRNLFLWQEISSWGMKFCVSLKISWEPGSLAPINYVWKTAESRQCPKTGHIQVEHFRPNSCSYYFNDQYSSYLACTIQEAPFYPADSTDSLHRILTCPNHSHKSRSLQRHTFYSTHIHR